MAMSKPAAQITTLLIAIRNGEESAHDQLVALVYNELRAAAKDRLTHRHNDETIGATDLVHETYVKLFGRGAPDLEGRCHFFGAARNAMKNILIDRARQRSAKRHGGGWHRASFDERFTQPSDDDRALAQMDDTLAKLRREHPRPGQVFELHCIGEMTIERAAQLLGISPETVKRDLKLAKAWLRREIDRTDV
jgi:RNA polymerase sigma factor (TIGR02999 family)